MCALKITFLPYTQHAGRSSTKLELEEAGSSNAELQILEGPGATFHFSPVAFNSSFSNISQFSQTFTYKGKMIESLLDSVNWQQQQ